jgi:hypothetical protein
MASSSSFTLYCASSAQCSCVCCDVQCDEASKRKFHSPAVDAINSCQQRKCSAQMLLGPANQEILLNTAVLAIAAVAAQVMILVLAVGIMLQSW